MPQEAPFRGFVRIISGTPCHATLEKGKPLRILVLLLLILSLAACRSASERGAQHHYPLTGKVVSLNAKEQTAAIDAAAIPHFMEAMTMDYPVPSKQEFSSLHVGDIITAIVDVGDDGYALSNIQVKSATR
jgi:hypothetical protein